MRRGNRIGRVALHGGFPRRMTPSILFTSDRTPGLPGTNSSGVSNPMTAQMSLFGKPTQPPKEGYTRFKIEVAGVPVFADFSPHPFPRIEVMHIEFQSQGDRQPNPLSETGYLSQFVWGNAEGLSESEVLAEITGVADDLLS